MFSISQVRKSRPLKVESSVCIHMADESLDSNPAPFPLLCTGPSPYVSRSKQVITGKQEKQNE